TKQTYNPLVPGHVISWLKEITSKTTIVNGMVVPGSLSSLGVTRPSGTIQRPTANAQSPSAAAQRPSAAAKPSSSASSRSVPVTNNTKNDTQMRIVPRSKYGRPTVKSVLNKLYD